MMQFLAALFDRAVVFEIAQHALELGAHGILEAEGAGDLAGADLAAPLADEGENVSLGGKGRCRFGWLVQNRNSCTPRMIPKSGYRFSDKIMRQKIRRDRGNV